MAAAAALACAAGCVVIEGPPAARIPLALPLLLLLPGFAVLRALFPHGVHDPLRALAYSVGLSLALAIVGGVEAGVRGLLSTSTWAAIAAGVTVAAAVVAEWRRRRAREPAPARPLRPPAPGSRRAAAILGLLAALAVLGAAIALARTPSSVPEDRGYTVLSISRKPDDPGSATVEIASNEARTRRFRMRILVTGRPTEYRSIVIAPGETIEEQIAIPARGRFGVIRVYLLEQRDGTPVIYRRVRLDLPGSLPGQAAEGAASR